MLFGGLEADGGANLSGASVGSIVLKRAWAKREIRDIVWERVSFRAVNELRNRIAAGHLVGRVLDASVPAYCVRGSVAVMDDAARTRSRERQRAGRQDA